MASILTGESEIVTIVEDYGKEENSDPDQENEVVTATTPERVIKVEEVGTYSDYGLGLGVDATDPKPWTNKKSFRARHVTFENVLGIKDGILRGFNSEVTSLRQFQSNLIASVPTNELLSVGIDVEGARGYSVHKRSIGKKIISRTITFKSKFEDICCGGIVADDGGLEEGQQPFEDRLTRFIEEHANKRSMESLSSEDLLGYCCKFVEDKSITHYVHSIELGACYYRTMSEQEYNTKFGAKTELELDKIAEIAIKNTVGFGTHKFQSEVTNIGQIKSSHDGHEKVEEEAVVGVKLMSISSLVVNSARLRKAMEKALSRFINKRQNHEFGPFYISCGNSEGQLFLKVDEDSHSQLVATDQFNNASQFSIVRCDEPGDEHFRLVYEPPVTPESGAAVRVPSLFLCTSKRDTPQSMRDTVSNSDLALRSRFIEHFEKAAKLSEWVSGGESFYIICPERSTIRRKRRYLCVFKPNADGLEEKEYVTGCKPRKDRDKPDTHMLFSLIKTRKAKLHPEASGIEDQLDLTANKDKISNEKGPFFIVTNYDSSNENVYFKVEDCNVHATTDKSEASHFYIKREEGNYFRVNPYETSGGNLSRFVSQVSSNSEWFVPNLYLTAVVNWRGYSCYNRPLQLQHRDTNARSYSYLAFCEQKAQSSEDVELVESERWFDGKEAFYVKCSTEPDTSGKSSYLCVQRKTTWRRQIIYSTGCAPSIKNHNKQGRSMLFKLVKVSDGGEAQNRAKSERRVEVDDESANKGQEMELKETHAKSKDVVTLK